jgi:hypothetical protein
MGYLLGEFAKGLAAFYRDLGDHMSDVTLVTMSEFGRRVEENASHGTDHGHGNCMFVMGGGVTPGVWQWPGLAADKLDGDLRSTVTACAGQFSRCGWQIRPWTRSSRLQAVPAALCETPVTRRTHGG